MGRFIPQQSDVYVKKELMPQPASPFSAKSLLTKIRTIFVSFLAILFVLPVSLLLTQENTQAAALKPEEDWTKCSIKSNGQPGTLNLSTTKNYSDSNERSDPKTLFGDYYASTDENEPFFTEHNANAEGRWAGNGRRDTGTPYWHAGPFRRDGTAPGADPSDAIRVGGFLYLNYQDKYRFEANGHPDAESNWNRVMRWTEDIMSGAGDGKGGWYKDNNPSLDPNGKWLDRNCVLNTQIFRLWNDYKANNNPGFGFDRESGFYVGAKGIKSVADVFTNQAPTLSATQAPTATPVPTAVPTATPTPTQAIPTPTPSTGRLLVAEQATPTATPTVAPTTVPTQSTPAPQTTTQTQMGPILRIPTLTFSNQSTSNNVEAPASTSPTTPEDTTLEGTIGKDRNGNYFAPSAIVANNQLYVFVVGDDGSAYLTNTTDGTSWNNYTHLSGTFTTPIRTTKLTTGNTDYVYALGTGNDKNTYFKSTNSQGNLASSWNTINTGSTQYGSSTVQRDVRFNDHRYTFTTEGGKLKICVDKAICRAN